MSSAKDVLEAIQVAWNSSALLASYGNLQRDMKSYNKSMPYPILTVESVSRTARTCANEYWTLTIRITVRATTPEAVEAAIDAIGLLADTWQLTIAGGKQVRLQREGEGHFQEDEKVALGFLRYSVLWAKGRLN